MATPHHETFVSDEPFTGLKLELNNELEVAETATTRKLLQAKAPHKQYLLGQPRVRLDGAGQHHDRAKDHLLAYLRKLHKTDRLDAILPFMRYIFVQTPLHNHIMPLHHQKAHAREIVVNEYPGLHLLWYYERIFIKPVPVYCYTRAFWDYIRDADEDVRKAALGFMRSYYHLIQFEIDFEEACKRGLIPKKRTGGPYPTWEEWCDFIEPFGHISDAEVNRRFHYGELRLSRINRTAMLFKASLAYHHIYPQWGSFLAHILAPVITVFAVCSVVLNSMQVSLAALGMGAFDQDNGWPAFVSASIYFPVIVIILIAIVLLVSSLGILAMGVGDFVRANTIRKEKKQGNMDHNKWSHGMVLA
ncbi:hypothetical protein B0T26DRAFT_740844 [Lasiosphaeria miniovina]|uniref:Uncharacterized protein n=1 Tax=Lasiosphaeria miniovina TaxID=1954250 RepID=A0AA40AKH3_9PEZI|nr:uncharacterized protein B0T26DRAFT_740844 [Lasiosphaeria miniovina]KAK0717447.1 hypothetical protein B0T26DRAFT_740844 [Lasiosphaeria miniovina]